MLSLLFTEQRKHYSLMSKLFIAAQAKCAAIKEIGTATLPDISDKTIKIINHPKHPNSATQASMTAVISKMIDGAIG